MTLSSRRIDVHHHLIPPAFKAGMERRGITQVAGAPMPGWTPERSTAVMSRNGIETAILSLSSPGVYFGDLAEARDLARACNDYSAELVARDPTRFGMFAVLPMPFTEPACAEAIRALDVLKADGIVLLGSTEGVFLGDSRLEELMTELDRRRATVFLHPNLHETSKQLDLSLPGFLIEFLCDTTRAATNLIVSGTIERHPNISWILAHSGGFLPYIAWRLSLSNLMAETAAAMPQGFLHYAKSFYYDTALSPGRYSLAALKELVDPTHILFGSDFPFAPEVMTNMQCRELEDTDLIDATAARMVARQNALTLFPRFADNNESPSPQRTARSATMRDRLGAVARSPMLRLAERIRQR